jgi:hypothetical protein
MSWRFRKRITLGKGLRVNLSKSGLSLGLGPHGMNVNLSPRGLRSTVGIPGSGFSYQRMRTWHHGRRAAGKPGLVASAIGWAVMIAALGALAWWAFG